MAMQRQRALGVAIGVPALFVLIAVLLNALAPAPSATAEPGSSDGATGEPTRAPMVEESLMPIPDPVELGGPNAGVRDSSADTADESSGIDDSGVGDAGMDDASGAGAGMDDTGAVDRPSARAGKVRVSYSVDTRDPVAFITIDDGVHKPADALDYVQQQQLPVTAFLTTWTVGNDADYFTDFTRWGSVQNHTVNHASFTDSATNLNTEICKAQRLLRKDFGSRPWMLRPPYGSGSDRSDVKNTAQGCGINQIVMWDASVNRGKVVKARGELRPGSIILLHFRPELKSDLEATVKAIRKAGLEPADLADYLVQAS